MTQHVHIPAYSYRIFIVQRTLFKYINHLTPVLLISLPSTIHTNVPNPHTHLHALTSLQVYPTDTRATLLLNTHHVAQPSNMSQPGTGDRGVPNDPDVKDIPEQKPEEKPEEKLKKDDHIRLSKVL